MIPLTIQTDCPYAVIAESGALEKLGTICLDVMRPGKLCVVTDENVDMLYAESVVKTLTAAGFTVRKMVFPPGEATKSLTSAEVLLDFLAAEEFTRSDGILALGGGVVGDLSGFVASVYLRGIRYIQVPTTFLAAVDSSVGGKTGVNLGSGKNLAGTFWQPTVVVFDPVTIETLTKNLILDGLAETIKCGVIADPELFEYLAAFPWQGIPSGEALHGFVLHCVQRAIGVKQRLVEQDEKDLGQRQLLNFGHTIAHAIELSSRYTVSHGHAVAKGMLIMTRAAGALGWSSEDCLTPLQNLLNKFQFPLEVPYSAEVLAEIALRDKKRKGNSIHLVIPVRIGECVLKTIDVDLLAGYIEAGLES